MTEQTARRAFGDSDRPWVRRADQDSFLGSIPTLVSVPIGFLGCWLGSRFGARDDGAHTFTELQVRALTGLGAEKATLTAR